MRVLRARPVVWTQTSAHQARPKVVCFCVNQLTAENDAFNSVPNAWT
jgi:hypothetical protein